MDNEVAKRIKELLEEYDSLKIKEETDELFVLSGVIRIHRSVEQYVLNKAYDISVIIPKDRNILPYVIDDGKAIKTGYPHIYSDRKLCLATDIDMRVALNKDQSLVMWMRKFVEPYFVSYEYYTRYGVFPMGDRPHGAAGIIQSYMELFDVEEPQAKTMILFLYNESYRGHQLCPCGSGNRMRKCHGKQLLYFYNNFELLNQAKTDCLMIVREVLQNENS